jgi:hypothetical protein
MATPIYNDNATPFGSRSETIFRSSDGTPNGTFAELGVYEFESIDVKRPSTIGEKHDHIGRPKGWFSVPGFNTATGTVQIPANADATSETGAAEIGHLQNGDVFVDDFGFGPELWVIVDTSDPFLQKEYRKQQITMRLSPNPPAGPAAVLAAVTG